MKQFINLMEETNNTDSLDKKVGVVTELVKAVPIYQDLVQPAAQEIGEALGKIAKLVNIALAPVSGLVWGYDKITNWLDTKLSEKLQNIPSENIITPPINIAGPIIEAMRFTGENDVLRDMYANLLANAMNKTSSQKVHPRFVEIIKNMSTDEARILKEISDKNLLYIPFIQLSGTSIQGHYMICDHFFCELMEVDDIDIEMFNENIENLSILGILNINRKSTLDHLDFAPIDQVSEYLKYKFVFNTLTIVKDKGYFATSAFGYNFINCVVKPL